MRLAKKIAESGIASRREAERMIEAGRVFVDGAKILTPVCFVDDNNIIAIDGKAISNKSTEVKLWKFYKPRGVITTKNDPKSRVTVFDIINQAIPELHGRFLYIGRLDYNSEGLLLFTNDGNFARMMELPKTQVPRTYRVRILGHVTREQLEQIRKGVTIDGIHYKGMFIQINSSYLNKNSSVNTWITITLNEGKNREIRKVMEHFGCKVNRLIRLSYGDIELGKMQPGEIQQVTYSKYLKESES